LLADLFSYLAPRTSHLEKTAESFGLSAVFVYLCIAELPSRKVRHGVYTNLQNGRNTTLLSPRRIGKTGLIKNAFYHIQQQEKDAICIYIDIFSTKNQHDFVQLLGTASFS
jgi:hypothetical protein